MSLKAQKDTWGGGVVRGWPFSKMKSSLHSIWPTYTKSNWKSCKKKPTPIILSSKPNISSFSVISDRFSLCSPWKTHIFPKHPYFSKLIHKLIWISLQKIMIAPRKVYWRCCHPKFKFIILVPWLLPWIPQWLFPSNGFCHMIEPCIVPWVLPWNPLWVLLSNGFCHMIEPCIVPWVLPWNPLWVLLSNGFCHMNKPSLVAGKGWHFVRTFFVVGILSVPFFGLDFVRTISTCFGILSVGILSVGILSAHHNIIIINSLFQHFGFLKVRKVPITPYPSGAGAPVEWPFLSHETLLSTETGAFQQNLLNDKRTMNSIMQHRSERKYLLAQQCYSSQLNRLHFGSSLGCFVQRGSTWVKKAFFFNTISVATFVCLWSWKD